MDGLDSGRASEPTTTTHHNITTQHNKKSTRRTPSPWPQLPRLRPLPSINVRPVFDPSSRKILCWHQGLPGRFFIDCLWLWPPHGHFDSSPYPAFWMWACLSVYWYQHWGPMRVRGRWESMFVLIDLFCKKSLCELSYCRRGNSPFVLGLKALGFPSHSIWMRWRSRGRGGVRIWLHAIVSTWFFTHHFPLCCGLHVLGCWPPQEN
jgi:hypothetical protein